MRGECGREHDPRPYAEIEVSRWVGGWTGQLEFKPREDYCQIEDCYSEQLELEALRHGAEHGV